MQSKQDLGLLAKAEGRLHQAGCATAAAAALSPEYVCFVSITTLQDSTMGEVGCAMPAEGHSKGTVL